MTLEIALDLRAELGEGPIWDAARARLLFVNIMRGDVHAFDPATGQDVVVNVGQPVGAVAPTTRGDWLAAVQEGFLRVAPDTGARTLVARVEEDRPDNRMNDGYCDARGRFWAGTMALSHAQGAGSLYRLDPDGRVTRMLSDVTISNGIDWSLDGRLVYYIDTRTGRVDVFDSDVEQGTIANRRPFVVIPPDQGKPDGLIVDAEGGIWVALWGGGAAHRYTPDGTLDQVIPVPAAQVTKCAFGGPDLRDLYITTAWMGLSSDARAAQPHAGSLFRCRPGVAGRPAHRFAG